MNFKQKDKQLKDKIEPLLNGTDIEGRCNLIHLLFQRQAAITKERIKQKLKNLIP